MPPRRGEVWLFLVMSAKTRPLLVVSVENGDADRAFVTVVPHTTEIRECPFGIPVRAPFLKSNGAFLVQGVSPYPKAWAIRKLGMASTGTDASCYRRSGRLAWHRREVEARII
jgi:mRNA interferase MazF